VNCPSEVEGVSNDGILYVEKGNIITSTYVERMPEATLAAFSHVARVGSLEIIPSDYMVGGDRLNIIVLDNDLNKDPTVVETVLVRVATLKVNEPQKLVELTEDEMNSGRFVGFLTTVPSDPANPTVAVRTDLFMAVEPGDEIDVFYLDEAIPNGDAQDIFRRVTVAFTGTIKACVASVNATLSTSGCQYTSFSDNGLVTYMALPGDTITVNITDRDISSSTQDLNVTAYASPTQTGDYQVLEVMQVATGEFSGQLRTSTNPIYARPNDGVLLIEADTDIVVTYIDRVPRLNQVSTVT